jgi:hypothetical protein
MTSFGPSATSVEIHKGAMPTNGGFPVVTGQSTLARLITVITGERCTLPICPFRNICNCTTEDHTPTQYRCSDL